MYVQMLKSCFIKSHLTVCKMLRADVTGRKTTVRGRVGITSFGECYRIKKHRVDVVYCLNVYKWEKETHTLNIFPLFRKFISLLRLIYEAWHTFVEIMFCALCFVFDFFLHLVSQNRNILPIIRIIVSESKLMYRVNLRHEAKAWMKQCSVRSKTINERVSER